MMRRLNSKAIALIFSITIALFLSIILSVAILRIQIESRQAEQNLILQQAFWAAEAGIQRAIYELRKNPEWRPGLNGQGLLLNVPLTDNISDPNATLGYYSVEVKDTAPYNGFQSVWIKSKGDDKTQSLHRAIRTRVIVDHPTHFFISTAGDLRLGSGSNFQSDFLGKDVYFDVNDALPPAQRDININGDIYYMNNVYGINNPSVHLSPDSQTIRFANFTFTGVDLAHYREIAQLPTGRYINGNFIYTNQEISKAQLDTENGIVFVEGDLHLSGTVRDSVLFVASGDVYIESNLITDNADNPQPQLGLLAKKDVYISSSSPNDITINAFVMADGTNSINGGMFKAIGPKLSKGTLNFTGAMALRGNGSRTAADLNVFRVRNYSYNNQLHENPSLPLLPSFANIVDWREINPDEPLP